MARRPIAAAVAVAVLTLAGACGGDDGGGGGPAQPTAVAPTSPSSTADVTTAPGADTTTTAAPATTAAPSGQPPPMRAGKVADFDGAIALALRAGDPAMYVAEKGGRVKALRNGAVDRTLVLDLSGQVSTGSEQGLLGLAFSPSGNHLYVDYTNREGDTRVVEYAFTGGRADTASRRELLAVDQPFSNHNGGQLVFGPDGFLYISLGDGGGGGDPQGNAQRLDTLLGKILRIDPSRQEGGRPYAIPPGNPFASRQGARPEIWAYGLRNPWRFTFDRETGAMWVGDVGQNSIEEISAVEASSGGQNYGWNLVEGTRRFSGAAPAGAIAPVHEYPNGDGNCSVTGGYVYRGARMPGLRGSYVFADYCGGELRALVRARGTGALRAVALGPTLDAVSSFGEDEAGEVYVLSLSSGLYRLEPTG